MSGLRLGFVLAICGCLVTASALLSPAATVMLYCPWENPSGPIRVGIDELERVMAKQGWTVRHAFGTSDVPKSAIDLRLSVMPIAAKGASPLDMEKLKLMVPDEIESYAILKSADSFGLEISVLGRDDVGAMYGAFELAEQLEGAVEIPIAEWVKEGKGTPRIHNRGIQIMIHKQALDDAFSWFHSETFWKGFLGTLARNRFNYLELQGVYDLMTTEFSNALPYFTAGSGISAPDIERNLRSLNRAIQMAHDRGLAVSLVNSGVDWGELPVSVADRGPMEQVISIAVGEIIKQCPLLDGVGFMVDNLRLPADFYQKAYVDPIAASGKKPILIIHTWAADPKELNRLVESNPNRSVLEVKFNADHLALPYPATGGRMGDWKDYSFQDYFRMPRKYGLMFQIAFNGTHRIFPWGDTTFIRRTLENSTYAGANGFILQTFSSFMPHADAYSNPVRSDLRYYEWTYERDWYWFLLWGRLAYNPDTPKEYFEQRFQSHFGRQAGIPLFNALRFVSQVVPTLAATCFRGPGIRDFAPEFEPPCRLEEVLKFQPLDAFSIRSVSEEIDALISGKRDGRYSPLELLDEAARAAEDGATLAEEAGQALSAEIKERQGSPAALDPNALKEWNAWLVDCKALAALGRYWCDRVSAAIQVGIYQKTGDIPSLIIASEKLGNSGQAWQNLQNATGIHYRPLLEMLRNQQTDFHWKQKPSLENEDKLWVTQLYNSWLEQTEWSPENGHFPLTRVPLKSPALLTLSIPPKIKVDSLHVQYQNQAGETARFPMTSTQLDGVYYAEIPPNALTEGVFQYFFLGKKTESGDAWMIPNNQKPFTVMATEDRLPPICVSSANSVNLSPDSASIAMTVSDPSGLDSVFLWWKRFPSDAQWAKLPMEGTGETFQGVIPITKEGVQYAIEAADLYGNVIRFPDMKSSNPYRTIPPYE